MAARKASCAAGDGRHGGPLTPAADQGQRQTVAAGRPDQREGRSRRDGLPRTSFTTDECRAIGGAPGHDRGQKCRQGRFRCDRDPHWHMAICWRRFCLRFPTRAMMNSGGDRAGRMRLPLEIVEAVRREMHRQRCRWKVFVRVSAVDGAANGWNLDDTAWSSPAN